MKAIDLLRWISYEGITGEYYMVLNIDEDFDFESFFGYKFKTKDFGNYFIYYSAMIEKDEIRYPLSDNCRIFSEPVKPTFSIDTEDFDKYGEKLFIHFYKIDD